MKALEGIRVLDLSQGFAGPYCTKLLAAFGAEVIKVEPPGQGDWSRRIGPFGANGSDPETSPAFLYLNTGKKGITLNIEHPAGRDLLRLLVQEADVVVESFRPGYLAGLGLGYTDLCRIRPDLIMASVTDFGQSGPYRDYKGGRLPILALSGHLYITGEPDREPLAYGGEFYAYQGGLYAYIGILAALFHRPTNRRGQHLDISLLEGMTSLHQFTVNRYVYSGTVQRRSGNRHPFLHPVTLYPCRDGWVSIAAVSDDQAERLLTLMEMPHLLSDPRFRDGLSRRLHADAFDEAVKPWFRNRTRREIVDLCQEWRVPAAPVNDPADLLQEEQLQARRFWQDLDHPRAGPLRYPGPPFLLPACPAEYSRAPLLGEHNEVVYRDGLKITEERLLQWKNEGVL